MFVCLRLPLPGLALVAGLAVCAPASAQTGSDTIEVQIVSPDQTSVDAYAANQVPAGAGPGARFTLGAGVGYAPDYFGSEDYSIGPAGIFRFDYIRLPGGLEFGSTGAVGFVEGFGPRGSLRYIPSRKESDNSELRGLDNVDAALELGLGIGYDAAFWRAFADFRYGVIGHSSFVGELGADAILRPNEAWVVNFGPRASWGASNFMSTYFGVTPRESERSGLDDFDASSGFYGVGAELGARYSFSEAWGLEGRATYERLINDAADSPITEMGSANQFGVQVLVTRSLSLGF